MGCRTLIGATSPGGRFTARWLHWGAEPDTLITVLQRIWTDTFAADTADTIAGLLAYDWSDLASTAGPEHRAWLAVAGVGHRSSGGTGPLRHGHIGQPVTSDLEWLYLLDADTDTVLVYEATCHQRWLHHSRHPLDPSNQLATSGSCANPCTIRAPR